MYIFHTFLRFSSSLQEFLNIRFVYFMHANFHTHFKDSRNVKSINKEETDVGSFAVYFICSFVVTRTTVISIEKRLTDDSLPLWKKRAEVDYIILMDWQSSGIDLELHAPLFTLKQALFKVIIAPFSHYA